MRIVDEIPKLLLDKDFNESLNKTSPKHLRDDLKQEISLALLGIPEDKFQIFDDMKYYAIRIMWNMVKNQYSELRKYYRRDYKFMTEIPMDNHFLITMCDTESTFENLHKRILSKHMREYASPSIAFVRNDRLRKEMLEDRAMNLIDGLEWFDKAIIQLFLEAGTYRAMQEKTGIAYSTCFRKTQKALAKIKIQLT